MIAVLSGAWAADAAQPGEAGKLVLEVPAGARFEFGGIVGERVQADIDNWLLIAPDANPGMLEMFALRDRQPVPALVPWAGEFVGKYLISAIQAVRMTRDARLRPYIANVIERLIALQADDGYLGPFPKDQRLLGNWDLWGHYHIMLALMMWYEDAGDEDALQCALSMGDCVCNTFLDTGRRVIDAGSHEMNMAIITSLGRLYRHTGDERHLRMMREVEKDWESAGDYFRQGLAGVEYYRTPRPRWESLHDLQGLTELYRITGDERYRTALENLWRSIARTDVHPSGSFTTNEQAIGNPYTPGAIETCCTTAWMALCVDMLELSGDPHAADLLELAHWNSMLGSQHPTGRWWTYNTPMDGVREASAHTIVFQARFGTPELNCCSVNAPRGLGVLSEWAVMLDADGPVVNYYGPGTTDVRLRDGSGIRLAQVTEYPVEPTVRLAVTPAAPRRFDLRLRIPAWSTDTSVTVNGEPVEAVEPGTYLSIEREWRGGDVVELTFDLSLRCLPGALGESGKAVILRGPLLLAFDQAFNTADTDSIPEIDASAGLTSTPAPIPGCRFKPMLLEQLTGTDGRAFALCDFATAGANGTHYASWLPARGLPPAGFHLETPAAGATLAPGYSAFSWADYRDTLMGDTRYALEVSTDPTFARVDVTVPDLRRGRSGVALDLPGGTYYWRVTASNKVGSVRNSDGPRTFTLDPALPRTPPPPELGQGKELFSSALDGTGVASVGSMLDATDLAPAADRRAVEGGAAAFNGTSSMVRYALPFWPEDDYSFAAWVRADDVSADRFHQVFSAWCKSMDDPLRVYFRGGSLFAGIEAGGGWTTPGVQVPRDAWVHVVAVKEGGTLTLYLNGRTASTCPAPWSVLSGAQDCAVGANPHFTGGNEHFPGTIDDAALYARALSAQEIAEMAARS